MSLPSFKNRISSHSLSTESKMWDDMMMHVPESASFLRISECKSTLLGSSAFMGSSNRRYRAPVAYAIARVSYCFMPWLRVRILIFANSPICVCSTISSISRACGHISQTILR